MTPEVAVGEPVLEPEEEEGDCGERTKRGLVEGLLPER